MAARTTGFSLRLSDIFYTLSLDRLISIPPVAGLRKCGWFKRVAHPE